VTCFCDWVKSGQWCRGVDVSVSFFHHDSICERSVSRPGRLTIGESSHCIFRGPLVEVTLVCETADAHTCWEGLPPQYLFTWSVQEFQFAQLQLHFLLWQHSLDVSIATLGVLWLSCTCSWFYGLNLIALLLIVDVRLWGSVQFLAQARPVLCSHAFRLCTVPLVIYNCIEYCIMLSVWVCLWWERPTRCTIFLIYFNLHYQQISNK